MHKIGFACVCVCGGGGMGEGGGGANIDQVLGPLHVKFI